MPIDLTTDVEHALAGYLMRAERDFGRKTLSRVSRAFELATSGEATVLPSLQAPRLFYFPGLTASTFFAPESHAELQQVRQALERLFVPIRREYLQFVSEDDLLAYPEQVEQARTLRLGTPEEGMLLPRHKWGTFSLRLKGRPVDRGIQQCPSAGHLIEILSPSLAADGAIFYSVLAPGVHIPPHHDATNARITCHLGVVIPEGCALMAGNEVRYWEEGRCLFFDASFRHEAWNTGGTNRVCLIVDLWHPDLSTLERQVLTDMQGIIERGAASKDGVVG
jgi:hypothetical protein